MKQNLQGHYAGFISRLLAFVIDVVIIMTALTVVSWFATTVNSLFRMEHFLSALVRPGMLNEVKIIVATLVTVSFYVAYPLLFWTLTGQTPGKMLLGLRVVTADGHYLSFGRSIRRLIGFVLAALLLYLGFLWILVDDRRQGLHDKIAATCVVYSWAARPDETFLRDVF